MELKKEAPNTGMLEAKKIVNSDINLNSKISNFDDIIKINDEKRLNHLGINRSKYISQMLHYNDSSGYKDLINLCEIKDKFEVIDCLPFVKLIIDDSIYYELTKSDTIISKLLSNREFAFLLSIIGLYKQLTDSELLQIYNYNDIDSIKTTIKYLRKLIIYRQPLAVQHLNIFYAQDSIDNSFDAVTISMFMSNEVLAYYLFKSANKELAEETIKNDINIIITKFEDVIEELQSRPSSQSLSFEEEYRTLSKFVKRKYNKLYWNLRKSGKLNQHFYYYLFITEVTNTTLAKNLPYNKVLIIDAAKQLFNIPDDLNIYASVEDFIKKRYSLENLDSDPKIKFNKKTYYQLKNDIKRYLAKYDTKNNYIFINDGLTEK